MHVKLKHLWPSRESNLFGPPKRRSLCPTPPPSPKKNKTKTTHLTYNYTKFEKSSLNIERMNFLQEIQNEFVHITQTKAKVFNSNYSVQKQRPSDQPRKLWRAWFLYNIFCTCVKVKLFNRQQLDGLAECQSWKQKFGAGELLNPADTLYINEALK